MGSSDQNNSDYYNHDWIILARINSNVLKEKADGSGFEEIVIRDEDNPQELKLIEAIEDITGEECNGYYLTHKQIRDAYKALLKNELGLDISESDIYTEKRLFMYGDELELMMDECGLYCPYMQVEKEWFSKELDLQKSCEIELKGRLRADYQSLKKLINNEATINDYIAEATFYTGDDGISAAVYSKSLKKMFGLIEADLKKVMGKFYISDSVLVDSGELYIADGAVDENSFIRSVASGSEDFFISATGKLHVLSAPDFEGPIVLENIKQIESISPVREVAAGFDKTLLLDAKGDVYTLNKNLNDNVNGSSNDTKNNLTQIDTLPKAISISAAKHFLVLAADGSVYAFGRGECGQLGNNYDSTYLAEPTKIENLPSVIAVSTGGINSLGGHSLFLTGEGFVYACGWNISGMLGLKDNSNRLVPTKIYDLPPAIAISAGALHSLVLSADGSVYSFGSGLKGRLGQGDEDDWYVPAKIKDIPMIQAIAAGESHSLLLTVCGKVLSFGEGLGGQLGHNDNDDKSIPTLISLDGEARAVFAGYHRSIILMADGSVKAFGKGSMVTKSSIEF